MSDLSHLLDALSADDLQTLGVALRSGRLVAPFSIVGIQRLLGVHVPAGLTDWLNAVDQAGCKPGAMSMWLEAVANLEDGRLAGQNAVQLVTTAPLSVPGFYRDTAVVVQDLFRRARQSILISTYGIFGGREIFQDLGWRMNAEPNLSVRMFLHGGQKSASELLRIFEKDYWPHDCRLPEVYRDAGAIDRAVRDGGILHAKCVLIDSEELFVTSANFTDAAHYRNVEAGLLVKSSMVAVQATHFFESLATSPFCVRLV